MEHSCDATYRWGKVLDSYELHFAVGAPWLMWMVDLIRDVCDNPRAKELYANTSMYSLCVFKDPAGPSAMDVPFIAIDVNQAGQFEFRLCACVGRVQRSEVCSAAGAMPMFWSYVDRLGALLEAKDNSETGAGANQPND